MSEGRYAVVSSWTFVAQNPAHREQAGVQMVSLVTVEVPGEAHR